MPARREEEEERSKSLRAAAPSYRSFPALEEEAAAAAGASAAELAEAGERRIRIGPEWEIDPAVVAIAPRKKRQAAPAAASTRIAVTAEREASAVQKQRSSFVGTLLGALRPKEAEESWGRREEASRSSEAVREGEAA